MLERSMLERSVLARFVLVLSLLLSSWRPALSADGDEPPDRKPPQVGEVAPALGGLGWLQLDGQLGSKAPDLLELRGKVVVVTSFGHYCDSCVKTGIPTANALRTSNLGELCVIGFTGPWGELSQEEILAQARKLGVEHAIGWASYFAEDSPYLDMLSQPSLTHAYVISRAGGILWKGDASSKRAEYLAAVREALDGPQLAPLPQSIAPELTEAVLAYSRGELGLAAERARSVAKKFASRSTDAAQRVRDDCTLLLERIETSRTQLMDALERAGGAGEGQTYQRLAPQVRRALPKSPEAARCDELDMYIAVHTDKGPENRAWAQWYELAAQRPPTFPAFDDKAAQKFARELAKYAKTPSAPGVEQATRWIASFEALPKRK